ncbi:hypothetical protein FT4114_02510 [Francisella tularensis subsp. tularensis WY-00W4114]|nr:hypothetical protein FT4114_02510 [Francisella tularensis subsp. tularensis WY-00W4114]EKM87997.1 hypothetical protein B344_02505 [Francisella tularensis subsp. tularensis 831]EKM88262.1 hypothetical protein B345_02540 [Francisella tularensis subsp. tularensis AS_713]EKM91826.1 hypothetical protein B341_02530 [Francisella tularensis subsp. tularensis 70102010]EKM93026.1 hypothetical protein B342_02540 [Francisella tularensis subsp. tularensis 80700103]EKT90190.1 hypothetical protein B229_02
MIPTQVSSILRVSIDGVKVVINDDIIPIAAAAISNNFIENQFIKIPIINIANHIATLINVKAKPILLL